MVDYFLFPWSFFLVVFFLLLLVYFVWGCLFFVVYFWCFLFVWVFYLVFCLLGFFVLFRIFFFFSFPPWKINCTGMPFKMGMMEHHPFSQKWKVCYMISLWRKCWNENFSAIIIECWFCSVFGSATTGVCLSAGHLITDNWCGFSCSPCGYTQ